MNSPYNQRRAKIRVGTSSSDEATVPLSLFSTFKNAGIEENEAKQSARKLENDFGDVWSSEDEKKMKEEKKSLKTPMLFYKGRQEDSANKREDEIIRKRLRRELKRLS